MPLPDTIPCLLIKRDADPDSDPDAFDHASEVYGDWPDMIEPCDLSPVGQCQYTHHDGFENCIHCGKGDGVL